jgi:hypothetical protein
MIGWYPFGRIIDFVRWILWGLDGPDLRIPLRVSDLILATRSRSNGRGQRGEGSPWKHTDGEVRRVWRSTTGCSGGLLAMGESGRRAGWRGEDGSKIGGVYFFLELRGGVAGGAPGDGEMQVRIHSSSRCKTEGTEGIRRCAGTRGGRMDQREGSKYRGLVGIDGLRRRYCGSSA